VNFSIFLLVLCYLLRMARLITDLSLWPNLPESEFPDFQFNIVRASVIVPVIAVATAVKGLARKERPPLP